MLFSQQVLADKKKHLDRCPPALVAQVVRERLGEGCVLTPVKRLWEPGGGSTLFRVTGGGSDLLLKVKHLAVCVESRLECEREFSRIPSLRNEYDFLTRLHCPSTPDVAFYLERDGYCFLALEWLEPFLSAAGRLSAPELLSCWQSLYDFTEGMFRAGIVHTDIHEGNLLLRENALVLCDFEEARQLPQGGEFRESLDCRGAGPQGDVGRFPAETGLGVPGYTCLDRLRTVFRQMIRAKLPEYLATCNFDCDCPFNQDQLQEVDPRVYQSISLGGVCISGQRPVLDMRQQVFRWLLARQPRDEGGLRHLDIGSNMGLFCFLAVRAPGVASSLGLEAFRDYVLAAELLKFVLGDGGVSFREFVCGKDDLASVVTAPVDVCTMLSVYHHIRDKELFLAQLRRIKPRLMLAEFATQERYYPERGSAAAEMGYVQARLGYGFMRLLARSRDYHRPLVLFCDQEPTLLDRMVLKLVRMPRVFGAAVRLLEGVR